MRKVILLLLLLCTSCATIKETSDFTTGAWYTDTVPHYVQVSFYTENGLVYAKIPEVPVYLQIKPLEGSGLLVYSPMWSHYVCWRNRYYMFRYN